MYFGKETTAFRQHICLSDNNALDFLHLSTLDRLIPIGLCSPARISRRHSCPYYMNHDGQPHK